MSDLGHLYGMGKTRRASIHYVKKQHSRDRKGAGASTSRVGILVIGGREPTLGALIGHTAIVVKSLLPWRRDRLHRKQSPVTNEFRHLPGPHLVPRTSWRLHDAW